MRIRTSYFALLREQAAKEEEVLETGAQTPRELYGELARRYGFTLPETRMKAAVNDAFVPLDNPLKPDDHVIFILPVSGG